MKALTYLLLTIIKNALLELRKKPGQLIFLLVMVGLMAFVFVTGQQVGVSEQVRDPRELSAILLSLYLFLFVIAVLQGLSSGATFYSMADVNLLFQTPIAPRRILLYGLIRQMGTSLLVGVFLLFQYTTFHVQYGVTIGGLLLILLTYGVTIFCAQLTSMGIYTLTSGSDRRRTAAKAALVLLCAVLGLWIVIPALRAAGNHPLQAAIAAADAPWIAFFPVAGWMKSAAAAAFGGSPWYLLSGFGLAVLYCILFVVLVTRVRADFYEDVLKATEVSFNALTAKKEGRVEMSPAHVKVGKTGLRGGWGASVFYYKHRLEDRRGRILLLDGMGMLMAACAWIFAFFLRGEGIVPIFAFATYLQVFSTMTGRWIRELILPYIYLLPESPTRKLWMLCRQNISKIVLDSLVVMIPAGLIVGAAPLEILAAVLARTGFGLLFMAGTVLNERILGGMTNKVLVTFFYFLVMLLIAVPGAILGTAAGMLLGQWLPAVPLGLAVTFVWNLGCSALIIYLCRNLLECAELSGK